jgi:hypothetical protein
VPAVIIDHDDIADLEGVIEDQEEARHHIADQGFAA